MSIIRFGGYTFGATKFSPETRAQARAMLQAARFAVVLQGSEVLKGSRFNSDDSMLWRLESGATEAEFKENPLGLINEALQQAAESDWYYTYEKDYGYAGDTYQLGEDDEDTESEGC